MIPLYSAILLIMRLSAFFLVMTKVLPVQMHEYTSSKNGLRGLKLTLLVLSIFFLFHFGLSAINTADHVYEFMTKDGRILAGIVNSVFDLMVAYSFYLIYHPRNTKGVSK